ncbi:MAG: Holliday junction branch migration protein RuvA [Saprospiraceae bacterium]|nr:Holliday junction branch migration protein RuvA [Saprospiraceae bacterium]MBK6665296.1 Holliday junction branch migration protein RuvA [Saprospiraceae bacterium]MBK7700422.1 Holliday junction branch migration protein RuvA [Saprospiraceae bacterium]MBK8826934.1 Holliday junction branch migration protein RuvA [Saprospiraceae bacterium]MBK8886432.1 Holliday junction branch migration protein RuvA [Saprospiraceae bacterium]
MIAYLNGDITYKTPTYIYVDCHGVGYHVNISLNTYAKLENLQKIKILTYLNVKEDEQTLFGFFDDDERSLFILLISVSGVGVNTARIILSYMTPDEVRTAIIHENAVSLGKVKGIGPKTAKRIILDLKDKVIKESGSDHVILVGPETASIRSEALSALIALGFPKPVVEKQIKTVMEKNPNTDQVEDLIKQVLKQMS